MPWTFVGRVEHLEALRRAVCDRVLGPVMITGQRGVGRTTILSRALGFADCRRDVIVRLRPSGPHPFAALRGSLAGMSPSVATIGDASRAISEMAGRRRLVVAADDAHLLDSASLLALREVSRQGKALLMMTCPSATEAHDKPDPTDCLRYERGVRLITLEPLSVGEVAAVLAGALGGPVAPATVVGMHEATGGNPRQLRALVEEIPLAAYMVRRDNLWRLGATDQAAPDGAEDVGPDAARIIDAAWNAWQDLACERADQLCRLAMSRGAREGVAPIWATLLLLRGHTAEAAAFLDRFPYERVAASPQLLLVKSLTLAIGLGRVEEVSGLLTQAANRATTARLILAYRAWILAVTRRASQAAEGLRAIDRGDPQTAMFMNATKAALARIKDNPGEAVFHLRRALATAETGSNDCPWMRPFLTASLIDSMLLSGRAQDAASIAQRFHAGARGAGWELAVAMDALMRRGTHAVP